jgi:hypothetical protein
MSGLQSGLGSLLGLQSFAIQSSQSDNMLNVPLIVRMLGMDFDNRAVQFEVLEQKLPGILSKHQINQSTGPWLGLMIITMISIRNHFRKEPHVGHSNS